MADKITLGTQVTKGSQLEERFKEFEKRYESRSEAIRAAIRKGLDADREDQSERDAGSGGGFLKSLKETTRYALLFAFAFSIPAAYYAFDFGTGLLFEYTYQLFHIFAVVGMGLWAVMLASSFVLLWYENAGRPYSEQVGRISRWTP